MARKVGTNSSESITGTSAADELLGMGGNDRIYANSGNDKIWGGDGNDGIYGQAGNDTLYGGNGIDKLVGDAGKDTLFGDGGNDWLSGGLDNDILWGGAGNDTLFGDAGIDLLGGGDGNDRLLGSESDTLNGDAGNDTLVWRDYGTGVKGNLKINGGSGSDTLHIDANPTNGLIASVAAGGPGGSGQLWYINGFRETSVIQSQGSFSGIEKITTDANAQIEYTGGSYGTTVSGGNFTDVFRLGSGNETITTGSGNDVLYINLFNGSLGSDTVTDFSSEIFDIKGDNDSLTWTQTEAKGSTNLTISTASGAELLDLTLLGVTGLGAIRDSYGDWW